MTAETAGRAESGTAEVPRDAVRECPDCEGFGDGCLRCDGSGLIPTTPVRARRRYGIRWISTWPHINLGISAHLDRKYGHLSLHLPFGVFVVGFTGQDA